MQIGFLSVKDTFERLDLLLNSDGSVAIDPYYEYQPGRCLRGGERPRGHQVIAVAWAEGRQAAIYAFKEITSPYWLNEKRLRDHKITMIGEKITRAAVNRGRP